MPNLYPTGTPQQIQLDEGTQQLIATANSTLSSGQTVTPEVAAQAQQGVATANQNIQNTMTPGARQGYLDNTNLGATQGNYDALAKQLAEYDNIVLKPEFGGQNPGSPSELGGVSGYYNPNLSYNTADAQTPEQVLYNANPKYALSSQVDQGNSIVTLLGTLNKLLGTEAKRGTNKYTSDLSKAAAVLGGLTDILRMNTDLTMKKAELEESRASRANTQGNTDEAKIARIKSKLESVWGVDRKVSPKDYERIRQESIADMSPDLFDATFYDYRNPDNPNYKLTDVYGKKIGLDKDTKQVTSPKDAANLVKRLNSFLEDFKGASLVDRTVGAAKKSAELENRKSILAYEIAQMNKEGRISDKDREYYLGLLPAVVDFGLLGGKAEGQIEGLVKEVQAKNGIVVEDGTYKVWVKNKKTGETGVVPVDEFDSNKYERI